jgi:AraC family transcriptional regulator of adaptative response / DNA-3-methyladenine glycosylase II
MLLNADQCYRAVLSRDARFDGRFFVAVRTTRIYCRPICRVKTPMRKNCQFFGHAAEAEVAGYRPCKRCRPELAPGQSMMEVRSEWARAALSWINRDFLAEHSLEELAEKLGVTDRHLRQVFRAEFGVSPVEYAQTQRLLLAKQLLTDTTLPMISVAMASGFRSVRRFNAALKARYRLTPTELRTSNKKTDADSAGFVFRLAYRPPLAWKELLDFLGKRAILGVESVEGEIYRRTVQWLRQGKSYEGVVEVRHEPGANLVAVRLSSGLAPVCAVILERVKRLFDLRTDPLVIGLVLGKLSGKTPGLRVPGSFDGFETAVRAVLGQQVSVAGATTLAGRFAARFGSPIETSIPALTHVFPLAARVARASVDEIARLGIYGRRAATIIALAKAIDRGELHLEPGHRMEGTLRLLRKIPGIGDWTPQYISMRALSWPDAFPHTDLGIVKALREKSPKKILAMTEKWRPWRSYAALHLWAGLETRALAGPLIKHKYVVR